MLVEFCWWIFSLKRHGGDSSETDCIESHSQAGVGTRSPRGCERD